MIKIFTLIVLTWSVDGKTVEGVNMVSFQTEEQCVQAKADVEEVAASNLRLITAKCAPTVLVLDVEGE